MSPTATDTQTTSYLASGTFVWFNVVWLALQHTAKALGYWGQALVYILAPLSAFLLEICVQLFWFHAQQDWLTLTIEAGVIAFILSLYYARQYLIQHRVIERITGAYTQTRDTYIKWYAQAQSSVRTSSEEAARLFPHICFFAVCLCFMYLTPTLVHNIANAGGLAVGILLATVVKNAIQLETTKNDDLHTLRPQMQYWACMAALYAPIALARYFGVLRIIGAIVPWHVEIGFFIFMWLHILRDTAVDLLYPRLYPIVHKYWGQIDEASLSERQSSMLINLLAATRIINERQQQVVRDLMNESGVHILSLVFFITPGVLTFVGVVFFGIVFPLIKTMDAVTQTDKVSMVRWQHYWLIYGIVVLVYHLLEPALAPIPLVFHLQLVGVLFLQLPAIGGATYVYEYLKRALEQYMPLERVRRAIDDASDASKSKKN